MTQNALYYPHIEFQDAAWLKAMAMYHDRIYRIVPAGVEKNDIEEIKPLIETDLIGCEIDPLPYSKDASQDFLDKIDGDWGAAALYPEEGEIREFERIHTAKVDDQVRNMFKEVGYDFDDNWFDIPTHVASNYMLYLATRIAKGSNLTLLSDNIIPWTATTYFNLDGKIADIPRPLDEVRESGDGSYLFTMVLQDLVPLNISEIPSDKIVKFREKRRDEIQNLRAEIENLQSTIENIEDEKVMADAIKDATDKARNAVEDYHNSADILGVKGWFGLKVMGVPAAAFWAKALGLTTLTTSAVVGTGIALGAVYSIAATRKELKSLAKNNNFSAFALLEKDFKNYTRQRGGGDINWRAFNCFEEYLND